MGKSSRSRKAVINTIAAFSDELVALICGLILPRMILVYFGSAYNGILSSIGQFISCISLMKAGIGGVTRVALYKPLAEGNTHEISAIVVQTEQFMRKIALIFIVCVVAFAAAYPIFINKEFDWAFSFTLILIIAFSTFAQYYFGITYHMLLAADQKQSVTLVVNMAGTVLSTVIAVVIMYCGGSIHLVKLGSSIVFVISPIFLCSYVRKKYKLDRSVSVKQDMLGQRWDALGHETANFVNNNTDVMILTVFSGLNEVSVYTVYNYVISAIRRVVTNFIVGFGAAFGNMYAKKEYDLMQSNLRLYELIVFSLSSVIYAVTFVMITPFVMIYTSGVHDVDYYRPVFAVVFTLAGIFSCFRIPYETVVKAVGHYKQTKNASFAEAGINIVLSLILVGKFGIVGIVIGTLIASIFRTVLYAAYLSKNILSRSIFLFIKHVFIALGICVATWVVMNVFGITADTILQWVYMAAATFAVALSFTALTNIVFYFNDSKKLLKKLLSMLKKKGTK